MRTGGRPATPTAREPQSLDAAYAEAVKRLARQSQSRAMLEQRLRRLGYADTAVTGALDRAVAAGYLNDHEYAQSLVRRRAPTRGHALIARELRAKGIENWAAGPALEGVDPEAEAERAMTLARQLLEQRPPADPAQLRARVGPRLSRRGFDSRLIYRICQELSDEWGAADRFDTPRERD